MATPWEVSDLLRRSVFPVDVLRTAATFLMDNNRDPGGTVHLPASSAFGGSGVLLGPFGSSAIFLRRFSLRLPVPLPPAAAVSSSLVLTHVSKPKGGSHEEPSELPELSTSVLGGPRSAQRRERERTWATVSVQRGWVGQGAPGPAGAGHAALSVAPQRPRRRRSAQRSPAASDPTLRRSTQRRSVQVDVAVPNAELQRASRRRGAQRSAAACKPAHLFAVSVSLPGFTPLAVAPTSATSKMPGCWATSAARTVDLTAACKLSAVNCLFLS